LRTARITTVARRNRFSMFRPAECTRSDRIDTSFPVMARFAARAGLDGGTKRSRPAKGTPIGARSDGGLRSNRGLAKNCRPIRKQIDSLTSIRSFERRAWSHPQRHARLIADRRIRPGTCLFRVIARLARNPA
jgi:hypothetical protein